MAAVMIPGCPSVSGGAEAGMGGFGAGFMAAERE